ncbi:MAG: dinitrogenase iron-molybdenum cofactor biosynthesis protein [Candidatus Latescibacterota bacterium]|nr:NifB/NifX family molybdenum-iron cluster-binding protein [Candidatus Latescibacterota bacterium]RKY71271.1 MAG: dinitrogenase iron-molybdenum cofactor biosynthesis protein [Candidatus Latescibacterota bacterium]
MKIAVTSLGQDLDAQVDSRFGRCAYFLIVDTDTMAFEAINNAAVGAAGGAGVQSGQTVANAGAKAVLTGNVGPNAYQTLSSMGLKIYTGVNGTVREVVEQFKQGALKEVATATVGSHAGMGGGGGRR